jgi:CBS domain-containing protein
MDIADIATSEYIEVDVSERLGKVRSIFESENPKGVIVTREGTYEGVLTERQILQSHIEDHTKAEALAEPAPKVDRTEDVRETARMLVEGNTKVAPVFEADRLWGIVTEDAILEAVIENLDALTVSDIYRYDVGELKIRDTGNRDHEADVREARNYIKALDDAISFLRTAGIERKSITTELVKSLHEQLLVNGRSAEDPLPGEFRPGYAVIEEEGPRKRWPVD